MFTDRTRRPLVLACVLAGAAPACAQADGAHRRTLHGTTAQGSSLTLVVGSSGRVSRFAFGWEAACARAGRFRDGTVVRPARRRATASAFTVAGVYTARQGGGYRFRVRL